MSDSSLGGIDNLAAAADTLPTFMAVLVVFLSSLQGVLALESVDPCRISARKMNILLVLEVFEVILSIVSEVWSFFELKSVLSEHLPWLHWVAPCLLAAGLLETCVDLYFTLAVITKSRVGWIPISWVGSSNSAWEAVPFLVTFLLSFFIVGWRLQWWLKSDAGGANAGSDALKEVPALKSKVMGFAVGWAVFISGSAFLIIVITDFSEDGAHYIAGISFLWKPDQWLDNQQGDARVWSRLTDSPHVMQEYIASAILDGNVPMPVSKGGVHKQLRKQPLHCGNAIVGHDKVKGDTEDRIASRLHKVVLLAEHLVGLPLLVVVICIIFQLRNSFNEVTFEVIRQIGDSVVIIALLEVAIGIKNLIWSFSGTSRKERALTCDASKLSDLQCFSERSCPNMAFLQGVQEV